MEQPALVVAGTGIRIIGQLTTETIATIKNAQKVLFVTHDPVAVDVIPGFNESAESLTRFYVVGKPRREILEEMASRVLECVRSGQRTCLVLLGHPGVFSWLGHEAVRRARAAGFSARMLPAISAADCLFADLGLDPGDSGCQSYEAMDFLARGRRVDPSSLLLLWQIGVMGDPLYRPAGFDISALPRLVERLAAIYGPEHEVIAYLAALHFGGEPAVERFPLRELAGARLSPLTTLCVPPQPFDPEAMKAPLR